jgi:hypothetical protein
VPVDYDEAGVIRDDDLYKVLVKRFAAQSASRVDNGLLPFGHRSGLAVCLPGQRTEESDGN